MATERQLYIDNGENIVATWTDHIAISNDGVAWETISKDGLDVSARTVYQNSPLANRNPGEPKGTSVRISLNRKGDGRPVLEFDVDDVANQAGWIAGDMPTNRLAAVTDITTWLASSAGGGGDPSVALSLTSVKTTGAGLIPPLSKAATIVIDGTGGEINGVVRPDGWSQSFEFHNDTLPRIDYDGNGTATMYVDILT